MRRIITLLIFISFATVLSGHPWKPRHYVIIDTDGGIDDLKAISMLLASPDVRVVAITVSPGVLTAEKTYVKVKSLLNAFYHEGIPLGINRTASYKSPGFPVAVNTLWGIEKNISSENATESVTLLKEIFSAGKNKIEFICLGGLSTLYEALNGNPGLKDAIKHIYWSTDVFSNRKDFNYMTDPAAAEMILGSDLPLTAVNNNSSYSFFDSLMVSELSGINTPYAKKLAALFLSENIRNHTFAFRLSDDLVPLLLHHPELFSVNKTEKGNEAIPSDPGKMRQDYLKILAGETVDRNQVIKEFPLTPSFYFDDIAPAVNEITEKHGTDEWISGILANELHRHLGVYAIIGVKMGIRAREYFNTGVDEFTVWSDAGSTPPLSCMNDGLQVSTGATPGHGLLYVSDENTRPSAVFTYMNKKIRLTLKPEIASVIEKELREINFIYGLDSDVYWELVRKNSIRYWSDLDRHEIFTIENF